MCTYCSLKLYIYLRDKETRVLLLAYVLFSMQQLLGNSLHALREEYALVFPLFLSYIKTGFLQDHPSSRTDI